ncbi:hypothetical protein BDZ94DRAFT_1299517 [Collybia nuda]|uniref:Uncharacterized protein n=1 Tax=Collybia nuda TaxID=64659 RepID=A0A9P5Y2B9_9AGAR|nr:hypothetical protein BDZ94DRAFT_1299517 [Collybia nuda]
MNLITPPQGMVIYQSSPRPHKRPRRDSIPSITTDFNNYDKFNKIPAPHLLLALPSLVLHPPTHRHHLQSIHVARHALRRCLALNLDSDLECRAWTALAELGLLGLTSPGLARGRDEDARWRGELQNEVEKALTKALPISQKHPSLRPYYPHLTILSARLSHIQGNPRFAHHTLKRLLSNFLGTNPHVRDPPHIVYAAHLALVRSLAAEAFSSASATTPSLSPLSASPRKNPGLQRALGAIQDLYALASARKPTNNSPTIVETNGHAQIALLARYLTLHTFVRHGEWARVEGALQEAEAEVWGSQTVPAASPAASGTGGGATLQLEIQILVLGIVYYTYAGAAAAAAERLARLHSILDSIGVGVDGNGIREIHFPTENPHQHPQQPLYIAHTHPSVLYALAFLLSAVAKRDAVGRRPKKGVFAREGLGVLARGGWGVVASSPVSSSGSGVGEGGVSLSVPVSAKEVSVPAYASLADVREINLRMMKIKADLMSEIIGLSIMRSEFDEAENTLNTLIAHTRSHGLFPTYAARITLQQAQLAHALGRPERALECYRVAEWVASGEGLGLEADGCGSSGGGQNGGTRGDRDEWVRVAARAGQVWVRIGLVRLRSRRGAASSPGVETGAGDPLGDRGMNVDVTPPPRTTATTTTVIGQEPITISSEEDVEEMEELRRFGGAVARECEGMGGNLRAVGEVIRACLVDEYLGAKTHLKRALDLATTAQDNHLRALVLALIAAQYLHTAREHAETMLVTCEQLGAGLGAEQKPGDKAEAKGEEKGLGQGSVKGQEKGRRGDAVGNAQLRLWVGERFLELYRWSGDGEKAQRQVRMNERFRRAVKDVERRGQVVGG